MTSARLASIVGAEGKGELRVNISEIQRVQQYLRQKFQLDNLKLSPQKGKDDSVEVYLGDEFIGVLYRDDEDEDISYDFHMSILDIDLPPES